MQGVLKLIHPFIRMLQNTNLVPNLGIASSYLNENKIK